MLPKNTSPDLNQRPNEVSFEKPLKTGKPNLTMKTLSLFYVFFTTEFNLLTQWTNFLINITNRSDNNYTFNTISLVFSRK